MKKKKWIIVTVIIVFIIALLIFGFFRLQQNIRKDKEQTEQNIEKISKFYDEFNDLAISFNEKSQSLTLKISNTFFTNLKTEHNNFQKILLELKQIIENMNLISNELRELCKATYVDKTTNRNCSSYQISLDSAHLVYEDTIKNYNDFLSQYNEWTKENEGYEKIEYYSEKENG